MLKINIDGMMDELDIVDTAIEDLRTFAMNKKMVVWKYGFHY